MGNKWVKRLKLGNPFKKNKFSYQIFDIRTVPQVVSLVQNALDNLTIDVWWTHDLLKTEPFYAS